MKSPMFYRTVGCAAFILTLVCGTASGNPRNGQALLSRHGALQQQLANNPFERPLHLESGQRESRLSGDIYAEIAHPFSLAGEALLDMNNWCDVLILHLNTKSCRAISSAEGDTLSLHIGRKHPQSLTSAQQVDFAYQIAAQSHDYVEVELAAEDGPLGTSDYRILLKMVPLNDDTSFLHLSYSYQYNLMAKVAMDGYLSTIGRDKVGFSVTGHDDDGDPEYVQGMRAVVERNTMRYYLAVEAFLDSLSAPPAQQTETRLKDWFNSSEQYATQLHEIDRHEYLSMKRDEIRRQYDPDNFD